MEDIICPENKTRENDLKLSLIKKKTTDILIT